MGEKGKIDREELERRDGSDVDITSWALTNLPI